MSPHLMTALHQAVMRAVGRLAHVDRGLAEKVAEQEYRRFEDETRREMEAARRWLETQWRFCRGCGALVADHRGKRVHECTGKRWAA